MIQLIQITREEMEASILNGVKNIIDELKKDYQPKQPEEYMTRDEVVSLLKINLSTLWSWTKKGKLTAYGIKGEGNRVYYKRSEIQEALIELKHK